MNFCFSSELPKHVAMPDGTRSDPQEQIAYDGAMAATTPSLLAQISRHGAAAFVPNPVTGQTAAMGASDPKTKTREERESFHLQEAKIVQGAAASGGSSSKIGIQRNKGTICAAGRYFSGNALLRQRIFDERQNLTVSVADVTQEYEHTLQEAVPFLPLHNEVLSDMDYFLLNQDNASNAERWKRNHLASGLFVWVFNDTTGTTEILDGIISAQKGDDGLVIFDIRQNRPPKDYKYADFVSSQIDHTQIVGTTAAEKKAKYLFLDTGDLAPITTDPVAQGGRLHGDRLALDTIKKNLTLFFKLINKKAHPEDLKILGMGTRYYSSYDACDNCFAKIYDARPQLRTQLNAMATGPASPYKIQTVPNQGNFPIYTLFYGARPYTKTGEATYTVRSTNVPVQLQASVKYYRDFSPAGLPIYYADCIGATNGLKVQLETKNPKTVDLATDVVINPDKVYLNVRDLQNTGGVGIPYET